MVTAMPHGFTAGEGEECTAPHTREIAARNATERCVIVVRCANENSKFRSERELIQRTNQPSLKCYEVISGIATTPVRRCSGGGCRLKFELKFAPFVGPVRYGSQR